MTARPGDRSVDIQAALERIRSKLGHASISSAKQRIGSARGDNGSSKADAKPTKFTPRSPDKRPGCNAALMRELREDIRRRLHQLQERAAIPTPVGVSPTTAQATPRAPHLQGAKSSHLEESQDLIGTEIFSSTPVATSEPALAPGSATVIDEAATISNLSPPESNTADTAVLEVQLRTAKQEAAQQDRLRSKAETHAADLRRQLHVAKREMEEFRAQAHKAQEDAAKRDRKRAAQIRAAEESEVALVSQIRSLVAQLDLSRQETARWKQELAETRQECESKTSSAQSKVALIEAEVAEWKHRAREAEQLEMDLKTERQSTRELREALGLAKEENGGLRTALREAEGSIASHSSTISGLKAELDSLTTSLATTHHELAEERRKSLGLADALARAGTAVSGDSFVHGSSPGSRVIRQALEAVRCELAEKESQLASSLEELASERRRSREFHDQVLSQAIELDELHAELAAQRAQLPELEAGLRDRDTRIGLLEREVEERTCLCERLEARVRELKVLLEEGHQDHQSQLHKERSVTDAEHWLMSA